MATVRQGNNIKKTLVFHPDHVNLLRFKADNVSCNESTIIRSIVDFWITSGCPNIPQLDASERVNLIQAKYPELYEPEKGEELSLEIVSDRVCQDILRPVGKQFIIGFPVPCDHLNILGDMSVMLRTHRFPNDTLNRYYPKSEIDHNPLYPNPDLIIRNCEVWRIAKENGWEYFSVYYLEDGGFDVTASDWNGYVSGDYIGIGLSQHHFRQIRDSGIDACDAQLRYRIKELISDSDVLHLIDNKLEPVLTHDYRYYNDLNFNF